MDRVSSQPKCVLYCQEATWRWKGWMNEWALVESGMGQLQVAVAGLGEGACGRACGQGQGTWYPAPGRLGTLARWHACDAAPKRGRKPPPLSQYLARTTVHVRVARLCGWPPKPGKPTLKARTRSLSLTAPRVHGTGEGQPAVPAKKRLDSQGRGWVVGWLCLQ